MSEQSNNFAFRFHNVNITRIDFETDYVNDSTGLELEFGMAFDVKKMNEEDANDRFFGVFFTISVNDKKGTLRLTINALGFFEGVQEITTDFLNDPTVKIGASTVAYPYVRSNVSAIIVNCGFNPITLPLMNFPQFLADQEARSKSEDENKS